MIYDVVSSEEDLDRCVGAHKSIYIILNLCVDVEEKLSCLMFGMLV